MIPSDKTRDSGGAAAPPEDGGVGTPPEERGVGTPPEESGVGTPPEESGAGTPPQEAAPAGEPEAPVSPTPPAEEHEQLDHERQLEHDLDELSAKAQKADEYLELAQRTRADFENYRKRAAREAAAAQERGVVKLARELLPAIDNLDRAVVAAESASNGDNELASGIRLVHAELVAALARAGVELYSPEGEPFDPERHEAVAQQPIDGAEPGTIVEVYQRGCRLGDAVIRPARVLVAG
jgi:molecular chaperone GrpE